jgi:hypothetical protein
MIINAAIQGYGALYEEARLGILLGEASRNIARIEYAITYRGGERSRSTACIDPTRFGKRIRSLESRYALDFLGSFHTHNEISGSISSALSSADKFPLCEEFPPLIEIVAAIWRSGTSLKDSQRYLQCSAGEYRVRVAGYGFRKGYPCLHTSCSDISQQSRM